MTGTVLPASVIGSYGAERQNARHFRPVAATTCLWPGLGSVRNLSRIPLASRYPQTLRAVATTSSSLRHCSSSVSRLPAAVEAKPHWGLRARCSIGT